MRRWSPAGGSSGTVGAVPCLFALLGLERQIVIADLDQIAVGHLHLAGDAIAIDTNAVVAAEVFDQYMTVGPHQPRMAAGHVPLREPDRVPFLTADGDLVPHKGDDGLPALIVFDDQLQHATPFYHHCMAPAHHIRPYRNPNVSISFWSSTRLIMAGPFDRLGTWVRARVPSDEWPALSHCARTREMKTSIWLSSRPGSRQARDLPPESRALARRDRPTTSCPPVSWSSTSAFINPAGPTSAGPSR